VALDGPAGQAASPRGSAGPARTDLGGFVLPPAVADADVIRVVYPDLNGTDRSRDVLTGSLGRALGHGIAFCRAVYHTTLLGHVADVHGGMEAGLPDISLRPDLTTLRHLPWEPGVAWCLADACEPGGEPCAECPRHLVRHVAAQLAAAGLHPLVGPELEYYLLTPDPSAPNGWGRYAGQPGNVYSTGLRGDPQGHLLSTLRALRDLGIGSTAANHEAGGGQFEVNLTHTGALDAADRAFLLKAAVKELARRAGLRATFMAKPFNDDGGSGFHIHLSLTGESGENLFADPRDAAGLSPVARHAIAGILRHAHGLTALLNPTINSYKRHGRGSLAPSLVDWGLDNRSALLRIPPERGAGTRVEARLGDASANPHIAIAGLLAAAYLGVRDELEPPPPLDGLGYDPARSRPLPPRLSAALDALESDDALTEVLGKGFTGAFLAYKRDEVARFDRFVTDWEFREYSYHL
jgi:glutamine synthetase